MEGLILPLLLFVIMYFALIRPQQRKMKEQQALIAKAGEGDRIMLSSGIYGTITEVVDQACYVELAEGIEILVSRSHIAELLDAFPTEATDDEDDDLAPYELDEDEDEEEVDA